MGKIFIVLVALFSICCFGSEIKRADYDVKNASGEVTYQLSTKSPVETVKFFWIAKVGENYVFQKQDDQTVYTIPEKFVGPLNGEVYQIVKKVSGTVQISVPTYLVTVICPCNGKSDRVPVVMDGKSHWHENKE